MSFIILEGIDRSGKSTLAERYRERGFKVIHLSAPDKKFTKPGYAGPSYLDEMLELYMELDGKDVVFDRSAYGEFIWPAIYGRQPLIDEESIAVLAEFENKNNAEYYLLHDPDIEAHWQRCVDNNEPLSRSQFDAARLKYEELADYYGFSKITIQDIDNLLPDKGKTNNDIAEEVNDLDGKNDYDKASASVARVIKDGTEEGSLTEQQERLQKANAINTLLSKRIIKQRGRFFDELELDIKHYLDNKLGELLGDKARIITDEEIELVKLFCERLKTRSNA